MWLVLLAACGGVEKPDPVETGLNEVAAMDVSVSPEALDFGEVGVATPVVQVLTLENHGADSVSVLAFSATSTDLKVETATLPIAPAGQQDVTVTWTPPAITTLSATVRLLVGSTSGEVVEIPIAVTGSAEGPAVSVTTTDANFGTVSVGCDAERIVTIANVGSGTLNVEGVALSGGADLALFAPDGGPLPALPWALEGDASQDVHVVYTPLDAGDMGDVLVVTSDDPVSPRADLVLVGSGRIEEQNSITYDVIRPQNVTLIAVVNWNVAAGPYSERFIAALPVFFQALQDAEAPYRVAFVITDNGEVDGNLPYIDDSMTVDDSVTAALAMLEASTGDLDATFTALENSIEQNRSWLLDESDEWLESRLNLVGMNEDVEQSSGNYVTHLAVFQSYKADPADVVFHGIGGDVPRGCGSARPAQAFSDAAAATGGVFLSICDSDWTVNMQSLAEGALGRQQEFSLTGTPAEWSIEVRVDDTLVTEGWEYDVEKNSVKFDPEAYPEAGSVVRIDYLMVAECPDAE